MARRGQKSVTIVLRREEVVEAARHGTGAWKVAYADFVTAMMAFFLLMWLINSTTDEQRRGLADYFSPQNLFAHAESGSGKPFGGETPFDNGSMVSDRGEVEVVPGTAQPLPQADFDETSQNPQPDLTDDGGDGPQDTYGMGSQPKGDARNAGAGVSSRVGSEAGIDSTGSEPPAPALGSSGTTFRGAQGNGTAANAASAERAAEQASFAAAAATLRQAVAADPNLKGLADQLMIDETAEGLRIQIVDQERRPMFATGSADLNPRARQLLLKVAPVLNRLREGIVIAGHTDAAPYHGGGKDNWQLSADRAEATLRLLLENGLPESRVRRVTGVAEREPLISSDPMAAANRRIAIVVLRTASPN
jgi:chemotaxis protein MotB